MNWKNVLVGLATAVFFTLLYLLDIFGNMGDRVYDLFLWARRDRLQINDVVFLDVDDNAIAYNGVFPWPRSITADALLRLKEFGARAAIFDIEYIDKGPQGVDSIYLNRGLSADFDRAFSEIDSAASEIISALASGRLRPDYINEFAQDLSNIIRSEQNDLFTRAQGVARDNDQYLIQASALFGKSWVTLNLRAEALHGEQAERRFMAEERFSYPVIAHPNAKKGEQIDILPPLPGLAMSAKGAGFTNVVVDPDGIRRRIFLAQNIQDHWYFQLAFAPLINYLGNPGIELDRRRLLIRDAELPGGIIRDISIPLDGRGRMLLDWPKTEYIDSYEHISFYNFSLLEDIEAELEHYSRAFNHIDILFLAQFDPSLLRIRFISSALTELFDAIHVYRTAALEHNSDEYFDIFVDLRSQARDLIRELLIIDPGAKANALLPDLVEAFPDFSSFFYEEAAYINSLSGAIKINLDRYEELIVDIENAVRDKFCILGRVDTGTTDIGANPFFGEYINVGTHGVVLDMILSETFINPVDTVWRALFTVIFVFLFFVISGKQPPVPRAITGFLITILVIIAVALLFRYTGVFFNPLLPTLAMTSAIILREIISYAGSEREKQFIRKAFSTYVSHEVVKEIIADPSRLQLGGTKRHMTTVFTDIRSFSTISEKLDPEGLVSLLNRYLTLLSDVILEQNGTIDKYVGDAIVAFFGAPVEMPDHALRACISAVAMKRVEADLNKTIMAEKLSPIPLFTRIGINSGEMVAGNMGTENKMNYTIMGNAVNLASRLEGVNKQYGTWILASENTIREAGERILARKLDRIRVVGINEPVRIYEILDIIETADPEKLKMVEIFHQALDNYENMQWKEAAEAFEDCFSVEMGGPSEIYLRRCKTFLKFPPPDDWDSVHSLTEK